MQRTGPATNQRSFRPVCWFFWQINSVRYTSTNQCSSPSNSLRYQPMINPRPLWPTTTASHMILCSWLDSTKHIQILPGTRSTYFISNTRQPKTKDRLPTADGVVVDSWKLDTGNSITSTHLHPGSSPEYKTGRHHHDHRSPAESVCCMHDCCVQLVTKRCLPFDAC